MKKIYTLLALATVATASWAGGLLHNTNQSIAWQRMMARGATTEIDGVFTNPAGLAWLDHEGWTMSLNFQSAFQTRDVEATFDLFSYTNPDHSNVRKYGGEATAPVIPSIYAAYKKDRWVASAFFGITGGGGKCNFEDGLPMFDAAVMSGIYAKSGPLLAGNPQLRALVGADVITPDMYTINTAMKGRQYVFSGQLGGTYRITDFLSAYAGLRLNYFSGNYKGHLYASIGDAIKNKLPAKVVANDPRFAEGWLTKIDLDTDQKGWGVTPILGVDFKFGPVILAAKYEFKTKLNIENDTKTLEATAMGQASEDLENAMAGYKHGVNTPNDLPSVLYVAAGYEILPKKLRAAVEYHFYDDKHAHMANEKQNFLRHGTHEILAGLEWDINKMFTVSGGFQNTDYGLSDDFQTHTAFSCDSYSLGFGGAVNITDQLRLNVGYFWTNYKNYERKQEHYMGNPAMPAGSDKFSRTNRVFGLGIDYKF